MSYISDIQFMESLHPSYESIDHFYYIKIVSKTLETKIFEYLKNQNIELQRKYSVLFGENGVLTRISTIEWETYNKLSYSVLNEIEKDLSILETYSKKLLNNKCLEENSLTKENLDWLQTKYIDLFQSYDVKKSL